MIIFDMDGVLVDVSGSYREVTRLSVVCYLRSVIGVKNLSDDFISLKDISLIKKSGGLNNDWDLTYAIINILLHFLFHEYNTNLYESFLSLRELTEDDDLFARIKELQAKLNTAVLESRLSRMVKPENMSVSGIYFSIKERIKDYSPFLFNHGDVNNGNLAKRIFQEIYLGRRMFKKVYTSKPIFYHGEGHIHKEALIPSVSQLKELAAFYTLSVATGRPAAEALYSLGYFHMGDLFSAVVTEDDVVEAEKTGGKPLRKPHPYMINLCLERCGYKGGEGVFYVGDMPDDMAASVSAGVTPIGFVNDRSVMSNNEKSSDRCLLTEKGAQRVYGNFSELTNYLKAVWGSRER